MVASPTNGMANDPGEWYAERRELKERLEAELAGARQVLEALEAVAARGHRELLLEAAHTVVRRLTRQLEAARYVGD